MTAEEQIALLKKELAEEREENGRAARASWTLLDAGGQPGWGRASVEEVSCGTPSGASRRTTCCCTCKQQQVSGSCVARRMFPPLSVSVGDVVFRGAGLSSPSRC